LDSHATVMMRLRSNSVARPLLSGNLIAQRAAETGFGRPSPSLWWLWSTAVSSEWLIGYEQHLK